MPASLKSGCDLLRINRMLRLVAIFFCGAFGYGLCEVMARGFSHISMGLLGGAAMCLIHLMNTGRRTPLRLLALFCVSAVFITLCELITGEIVNKQMGLNVWDYSMMPLNLDGQICLSFSCIWFALSAVGAWLDDVIRVHILHERRSLLGFSAPSSQNTRHAV